MAASNLDKFKKSKRKFETTVGVGGILAAGTTLPLTSVTGLDTSTAVTLVIGAGTATEEVVTGVVSGSDLINCVRGKEGTTDSAHSAGETVNMFFTETHWDDVMDGILVDHKQDGTHSDINADSITATTGTFTNLTIAGTATPEGWSALGATPDTVTALGNRSYSMVFNGTDLTDTLSPGMRLKMTRTVSAPTQCTDLNGTTQYYSRASAGVSGMTFTDDFTVSAWIKVTSYAAVNTQVIASRYNGTSGWRFGILAGGQVQLVGFNAGSGNYSFVSSKQSVPLNKWVHIAAQLDMSTFTATTTTSYVMFDGVDVAASVTRAGSNPTALIQAGNLEIGSENGGTGPFPGKIAQVAIYSAKVTQATILASINRTLTGSETSLISAYSFNNVLTDLNANANTLTANGGAVATATDSPFALDAQGTPTGTTEYGIVTKTAFSTNTTITVQTPEGGAIPTTGGVSAVSYSTHRVPYGFISDKDRWSVFLMSSGIAIIQAAVTASTVYNVAGIKLLAPIGRWRRVLQGYVALTGNTTAEKDIFTVVSESSTTVAQTDLKHYHYVYYSTTLSATANVYDTYAPTSATTLYLLMTGGGTGTLTNMTFGEASGRRYSYITLECDYV
ncbi:MAG TPA: LamG domain-containing protein [Candidatus Saccharibacteria bacterium]|nr:LamG domain-containing protein [Candidatus Saccharibacteria bacterium]